MSERHIVAFGGMREHERTPHPLLTYVLELSGRARPKVAFLPTARGDCAEAIAIFEARLPVELAERSHLALFDRRIEDLRAYLLDQDVIWVSGGNTANMLAIWRVHGVDAILREAWEAGIVLCGGSAGSLCWFEGGTTDSFNLERLHPLRDGLGFLPGTHSPHYDGEVQRRPLYHAMIAEGFGAGIAIDDDAAAHYIGTDLAAVVSARPGATAYWVERTDDGAVRETPLEARAL
jgi:peptidase E